MFPRALKRVQSTMLMQHLFDMLPELLRDPTREPLHRLAVLKLRHDKYSRPFRLSASTSHDERRSPKTQRTLVTNGGGETGGVSQSERSERDSKARSKAGEEDGHKQSKVFHYSHIKVHCEY